MKLKHTFLAAMLLSPLTLAATTSGQTDVSRQESTQRADSAQQNLQQQAGQWGLSADDYQRYQQLMKGPRGTQSPGLDPLSTLGIEAQTPAERRKFAEKWVKEEFARTQKELDFQRGGERGLAAPVSGHTAGQYGERLRRGARQWRPAGTVRQVKRLRNLRRETVCRAG
ncbi:integrating conjugative element protein [Salmonella enterica subsp. enterica]|nr:integrating conjugative element protein [Salmonella enterica subsp. enterica]